MSKLKPKVPEPLLPFILERHRYKGAYGGRGSGKTVSFAIMLISLAVAFAGLRILCTREIQRTIRESVYQVLEDEIKNMGLEGIFTLRNDSIVCANGSEFIFAGLRQMDITKLKSIHNVHIAWVEEAQVVTDKSWQVLIPSIRGQHPDFGDAEIWASFNPELDTDPTYVRFVENTPPSSYVVKINHSDNPWFPAVLEEERKYLFETDKSHGKVTYRHVWEGECLPAVEGAIFASEVARLHEDGRVIKLDYDPKGKLYGVMDLGWGVMAMVLVQKFASTVQIVGYREWRHRTYHDITVELHKEFPDVRWGGIFMPHDASHKDPKYGKSHFDVMEELGWNVVYTADGVSIPQIGIENYISRGREMFDNLYVSDRDDCKQLIHCLRRWRRQIPVTTEHPGAPMKDEFSHGSEAFCYTAVVADELSNDDIVIANPYEAFESGYAG